MTGLKGILINAKTEEICDSLATLFDETEENIVCCYSDEEIEKTDLSMFETIIVSTPLRTEFGLNFITDAYKKTDAAIIVLAKSDIADDVQNRIKFTGAFVLGRPFNKAIFLQTIKFSNIARSSMKKLEEEKQQLTKQLEDIRIIDRAKCCLIEYLNLTENQAHRHIQKQAMDRRVSQRDIADDILRTYGAIE